ncbi:D-alanyl-D-alanine carboxypeptidase family protein, partial [Clostridioides difficile]|nr:D-alanyl-D-alanine carboxypeptidase family protein [Clostridioides difficile]
SYTNCLKIEDKEKIIEIFYVPIHTKEEVRISIPEQCVYQISGNNKDGFIVTFWRNRKD